MRAEFPDRQLVTGVSILEGGHSLIVEVRRQVDGASESHARLKLGSVKYKEGLLWNIEPNSCSVSVG